MKQPTLPAQRTPDVSRTPLAVGESDSHTIGYATISVTRTHHNAWTVFVYHANSPIQVDELRAGPFPSEERAREVARNAYRTFATGRTVAQVKDDIAENARFDLLDALNRGDRKRVVELNDLIDRLTPADEREAAERMLAGIRRNMAAAAERDRPRTLADLKQELADAAARDRAERTGAAA